ncbi:zinc metalloprotease HtpX [Helicobacter sp. MIT 14-3879]|uniref:zinc metalloprotease HtpX n=1 Tax=Helicobacter sp. MIT 14-3879 TaxID=2040649 RepID=UPI000E1E80D8|nr:zinc metalloprotease HtpX [Helicobacter sp. MIT 14-3879]RDU64834.1 zinc metalloprotease HtpX [Helicobacter sp. MIT 14-3879]
MNFENIIRQNKNKTNAVLATYIIIFILIGLLVDIVRINASSLGGGFADLLSFREIPIVTLCMFSVAAVIIVIMVVNFKKIMLSGNEYKLVNPNRVLSKRESDLYDILEELVRDSKIEFIPELYIIDAEYMNAFASGWNEDNSLIAVTMGLIQKLDRDELKAVVAHELSHIRHGDIRLTLCVGILSNIMLLVANYSIFLFARGNNNSGAGLARIILLVLQIVLPFITLFLQMYLSRSREYMADSGAAYIMNDSSPMIRALQKISGDYNKSDYSNADINPTRRAAYIFDPKEAFSTHPSIKNRIKALLGQ